MNVVNVAKVIKSIQSMYCSFQWFVLLVLRGPHIIQLNVITENTRYSRNPIIQISWEQITYYDICYIGSTIAQICINPNRLNVKNTFITQSFHHLKWISKPKNHHTMNPHSQNFSKETAVSIQPIHIKTGNLVFQLTWNNYKFHSLQIYNVFINSFLVIVICHHNL